MARRPIANVANDLENVIKFFQERQVVPSAVPEEVLSGIKRMHRCTYAAILWRFRLKNLAPHGQVFIEEIASDALQILPQSLGGYGKTTKLLLRGIIENTWRHIYFSDHPVEFNRMNREAKWYLSVDELSDYPMIHPVFNQSEKKFDAFAKLRQLYSNLSAGVHGRRVSDLDMKQALEHIKFEQNSFENHVSLTESCIQAVNFVLSIWHREQFKSFPIDDRKAILATIPKLVRHTWSELD